MFYYLIIFLSTIILSVYNTNNSLLQTPIVQAIWSWDKKNLIDEFGLDSRITEKEKNASPYRALPGYQSSSGKLYLFSNKKQFQPEENEIIEIPTLGSGFLSYKKIGDKITFYSKNGEILWKKNYQSYPYSTPYGKILYLISGDGNQILIIDVNGNPVGAKQLDGRFLTDISNSSKSGSFILFSGGEYFRLDSAGRLVYKNDDLDSGEFKFFKSSAISENGEFVAVHFVEGENDYIQLYNNKIPQYKIKLNTVYPHKIYLSISNSGEILLNLREKIQLYSNKGEVIKTLSKSREEEVYQICFSNGEIFLASSGDKVLFLTKDGEIFSKISGSPPKQRVFLNTAEDSFYFETNNYITQLQHFKE